VLAHRRSPRYRGRAARTQRQSAEYQYRPDLGRRARHLRRIDAVRRDSRQQKAVRGQRLTAPESVFRREFFFMKLPELATDLARQFQRIYGRAPRWFVAAPGRVNVIGEHTDYNDGFVLPMAIERYAVMA